MTEIINSYETVFILSTKLGEEGAAAVVEKFKGLIEGMDSVIAPKWLELDKANGAAKVTALPVRDDIDFPFEEQLIVELYSK